MGYHNNDKDNSLDKVLKLLRLSDEALHQYDQKYRMMAENSNDIISLHRPADLTFLYTNSTIQRILGYYPREMIGKSALDFIHPEDHKTFLNSIKKARKIGEGAIQYRCRKKDGSYIWLESNGKTIQDEAGTRASLINTRDISERKHFERQIQYRLSLEEAVAKSARLFFTEKSPPLSEILKTLGEAVYVNRAYIFEFDENGITMSNTYEWCDSETKAQAQDLQGMEASLFSWWMSKLNQGENVIIPDISLLPPEAEAEKNLLEPQGIHSLAVVPICLANSRLVGFMGFDDIKKCREWRNEDIATLRVVAEMIGLYWERRNVENALRNSEKQMSAIIDFLPDATFVIDKQGKVITWNRAMEEMTGIKSEDILGKANYEYSLPFFGKRIPALIDMVLNPESKSLVAYLSIIEKDGVLVGEAFCPQIKLFLSGTASALYDAQGNKIGAIESLRNITERWQAE
ncbi:MAG: PAS domain S-box protein [Syntrophomonas sp.]